MVIWDKWKEELAALGPEAEEWNGIEDFITDLRFIAAARGGEKLANAEVRTTLNPDLEPTEPKHRSFPMTTPNSSSLGVESASNECWLETTYTTGDLD